MIVLANQIVAKRHAPSSSSGASTATQFPLQGKVASFDEMLGVAIVLDSDETHAWALVKDDFSSSFWSRLKVGSWMRFSDNGDGCVEKAEILV